MAEKRTVHISLQVPDGIGPREFRRQLVDGLASPEVVAFVRVAGILGRLPTDRSRERCLRYVSDRFAEKAEEEPTE